MGDIEKEILDQTKGVGVEVYKDLARPALKPIGEILGFLPRTVRTWMGGWEKWLVNREYAIQKTVEAIQEKVKDIPEDKLKEPEAYVAVPAIQQLSYCADSDELRDMYANLLVTSMNADKQWQVHPAFVDIIKQLNPDEAKFIGNLFEGPLCASFPIIDVNIRFRKNGVLEQGYNTILTNFTAIGIDKLENPQNICSYIDNLVRLNIISISDEHITDAKVYETMENSTLLKSIVPQIGVLPVKTDDESPFEYSYQRKVFSFTNFGRQFKEVCCGNEIDNLLKMDDGE